MNLAQRLSECERTLKNIFIQGSLHSFDDVTHQAKIKMVIGKDEIITPEIPLIGRTTATLNEPILVLIPNADPATAYAVPLFADPILKAMDGRITALENI